MGKYKMFQTTNQIYIYIYVYRKNIQNPEVLAISRQSCLRYNLWRMSFRIDVGHPNLLRTIYVIGVISQLLRVTILLTITVMSPVFSKNHH